jgi:hypothetical protein
VAQRWRVGTHSALHRAGPRWTYGKPGTVGMAQPPEVPEGPALLPGEAWYPRGQGLARTIVRLEAASDGQVMVVFRTRRGEFATSARNFQFWIERLSAAPSPVPSK